jgi:choline dehydrogenase
LWQDHPILDYNILADERDIENLVKSIQVALEIGASAPFRRFGARFYRRVFPLCAHLQPWSHQYWRCYVRSIG